MGTAMFDVWLKERSSHGISFRKIADGKTVKECVASAYRNGPGLYEVWNDRGSKIMGLTVPGVLSA